MGRGFFAATTAMVLGGLALIGTAGAVVNLPKSSPSPICGPARGKTLLDGPGSRIYALSGREPPRTEYLYGCLAETPQGRMLGSLGKATHHLTTQSAPLAIAGPWVAYVQASRAARTQYVVARDLRTGDISRCSAWLAPVRKPRLAGITLRGNGSFAWIGEAQIHFYRKSGWFSPGS